MDFANSGNAFIKKWARTYPKSSNSLPIPGAGGYDVYNGCYSSYGGHGSYGGGGGTSGYNSDKDLLDILIAISMW